MKYRITHTTSYGYSSPASVCHNVIVLSPVDRPQLVVHQHAVNIRPTPKVFDQRIDMFGNSVHRFSLEELHTQLSITATSSVTVADRNISADQQCPRVSSVLSSIADRSDPNWFAVAPFMHDSSRINCGPEFAAYVKDFFTADEPILKAANELTHRIYTDFKYDKDATQVDTPTLSAFRNRHGVCQDFAHVAVACLRSIGLPAKYVSGYLRTIPAEGKERLVGADQSHAWVSAYCGEELGWVEFDPTNDCLVGADHIPVATGRDYSDVVPIKGVFLGGGEPTLRVSVDVAPVEA